MYTRITASMLALESVRNLIHETNIDQFCKDQKSRQPFLLYSGCMVAQVLNWAEFESQSFMKDSVENGA